jgi:hypothetical protein
MSGKKSSYETKSSNETFLHNLLKEQAECENVSAKTKGENTQTEGKWSIKRIYLSQFSCEEGMNKVIQAHVTKEGMKNDK